MLTSRIPVAALLALAGAGLVSSAALGARDDGDDKCTWKDDHGDVDCGSFSVVFGSPHTSNSPSKHIDIRSFNSTLGMNGVNKFTASFACPPDSGGSDDTKGWEKWDAGETHLNSTIELHGGNMCTGSTNYGEKFDNMWIKYPSVDGNIDVPSDSRCGRVGNLNLARRCIIAL